MQRSSPDTRIAEAQIEQLGGFVPQRRRRAGDVSAWSVGQHLQHCNLSMRSILEHLLACTEPAPDASPTPAGLDVLAAGVIPRGVAQAPDMAVPEGDASSHELKRGLAVCSALLGRAPDVGEEAWFRHFALGVLRRDQAVRFIEIHNDHHMGIIREILRP